MEGEREKWDLVVRCKERKGKAGKEKEREGWLSVPAASKVQELNQLNNERKAKD